MLPWRLSSLLCDHQILFGTGGSLRSNMDYGKVGPADIALQPSPSRLDILPHDGLLYAS